MRVTVVVRPAPSRAVKVAVRVPGVLVSSVAGPSQAWRLEPPRSVQPKSVLTLAPSTYVAPSAGAVTPTTGAVTSGTTVLAAR